MNQADRGLVTAHASGNNAVIRSRKEVKLKLGGIN